MKIEIIRNCPSCLSLLERVNDQLFCRNDDCESKSLKKLKHFATTMKIKGLGERTIERLGLENISDIYNIPKEDIIDCIGEKLGLKLSNEIQKSKKQKLDVYLSSFGISLIGITASKKIARVTNNILNIDESICKQAGLGEKATQNLCNWVEENFELLTQLPIGIIKNSNDIVEKDITVCITGKLDNLSRKEAESLLESNGIRCVSSVSSKLNYLICDDVESTSSKAVKARSLEIEIMSFENFLIMEKINNG